MAKICIIGVYFGKLPEYIDLWLRSCEFNRDFDFLIISDNSPDNLPANVSLTRMTLKEMKTLADRKLGLDTALTSPYKCCDFKPVYGVIFEDLIHEYDFWGHCDFDMLFGDLKSFITDDILSKYDKILPLGHLSIYRNTEECKSRYMLPGSLYGDYRTVFQNEKIYGFDEWSGLFRIYNYNGLPMYKKRVFADISKRKHRFTRSLDKNYIHQVFYWEDGHVFRSFCHMGRVITDEYAYIHFQKRGFSKPVTETDAYYICPNGFIAKIDKGVPDKKNIRAINPFRLGQELKDIAAIFKDNGYLKSLYLFKTDKYLKGCR